MKDKLLSLQRKIVPEVIPMLLSRYQVLRSIRFLQPIGRRALADQLHFQERAIRNEVDFLRDQKLITCAAAGMQVTTEGEILLWDLEEYIREIQGLRILEDSLAEWYKVRRVIIVPGDADQDESVKKELARVTADFIRENLHEGNILAVTGGTTLAEVGGAFMPQSAKRNITIIAARGGLGEDVEIQANTVAAIIARSLGGNCRLLHAPDDLQAKTMRSIVDEPKIKEILDLLRRADMVLHGIGLAEEMATRRGMAPEKIQQLLKEGAVGEAFGYYFADDGRVVYATSSIGLQLGDLANIKEVIAVAGGHSKAAAVEAVLTNAPRTVLVIDEGAARGLADLHST